MPRMAAQKLKCVRVCVFCISVGFGIGCKSSSRHFLLTVQECKVGDIDLLISAVAVGWQARLGLSVQILGRYI